MMRSAQPSNLGVTSVGEIKKVEQALDKLDAQISENPGDFFEWRIANLRLCDLWLTPMVLGAPRITMLWMRYGTDAGKDAIEAVDDAFDEATAASFWAKWLFLPHYDFWNLPVILQGLFFTARLWT